MTIPTAQGWANYSCGVDFVSSAKVWQKTPLSGLLFSKLYADTDLAIEFFGDVLPDPSNTVPDTYYSAIYVNGVNQAAQGMVGLPGQDITIMFAISLGPYPAGVLHFDLYARTFGGSQATWLLSKATNFHVFELDRTLMPRASRMNIRLPVV